MAAARPISDDIALVTNTFDRVAVDKRHAVGAIDEAVFADGQLHVRGWIVTPSRNRGAHAVAEDDEAIRIDITTDYGLERPDVARALGTANFLRSGINTTLVLPKLARGTHRISFSVTSSNDRTRYVLGANRSFLIP